MQTHYQTRLSILLLVSLLCVGTARAQQAPNRMPPLEALQACQKKSAAQECEFTSPHGKVQGQCLAPEGKPLACRPNKPNKANDSNNPNERNGPPSANPAGKK